MNSSLSQKGSAHVVIIIIFVIAILGALGFVLWNNFLKPEAPKSTEVTQQVEESEAPKDNLTEIAGDETLGTNVAIKYPAGWTYKQSINTTTASDVSVYDKDDVVQDQDVITSPSGDVIVTLSTTVPGGVGGICDNNERKVVFIDRAPIEKYPNVNFLANINQNTYETTSGSISNTTYSIGASRKTKEIDAVTTQSNTACDLMYASLINFKAEPGTPFIQLGITFGSIKDDDPTLNAEKIQAKMKGEEYETAKRIVQSMYVKE